MSEKDEKLPRGLYSTNDWDDNAFWGYTGDYDSSESYKYKATDLTKKCTCGSHKTYGEDIPADQHADYCQIYKPREK